MCWNTETLAAVKQRCVVIAHVRASINDQASAVCKLLRGMPVQAWASFESKRGDASRAKQLFREAAEIEPDSALMLNAWATLEKRGGDSAAAARLYERAIEADPQHHRSLQVCNLTTIIAAAGAFSWASSFHGVVCMRSSPDSRSGTRMQTLDLDV